MDQLEAPPEQEDIEKEKEHTTTVNTITTAAAAIPFQFNYLPHRPTSWDPQSLEIPLNIRLDGCIVPSSHALEGARISYSHVVVLDGLVDDPLRKEIQKILLDGEDEGINPSTHNTQGGVRHLPDEKWERKTADMAGGAPTWGLRPHILKTLLGSGSGCSSSYPSSSSSFSASEKGQIPDAILEVQSRLVKLYPEYQIAYLPSEAIQNQQHREIIKHQVDGGEGKGEEEDDAEKELIAGASRKRSKLDNNSAEERVKVTTDTIRGTSNDCSAILANAAAQGDTFRYHVDADPTSFPVDTLWTRSFGEYFNGEPGKPLLVTLLIYIDNEWERDWGGETLFLDGTTDTGIFVRPKPGRAILMEQDVVHRVNPPSALAGGRLRLSLVWKLAFIPKIDKNKIGGSGQVVLARKEWGQPTSFGSAARVDAVKRQLLAEKNLK